MPAFSYKEQAFIFASKFSPLHIIPLKKKSTADNTAEYTPCRLKGNYSRQRLKTQCIVDKIRLFLKIK